MRISRRGLLAWSALAAMRGATAARAADWTRFRGPNGTGLASESIATPARFGPEENLEWKARLPGPGSSSPIVVGNRVYVTCWSGYAESREELGDIRKLQRHLVCLDRRSGEIVWDRTIDSDGQEEAYRGMFAENGYASHTPVSDGERIYVYFGKGGAAAFDLAGERLWLTNLGKESDRRGWGSASSPVLYEDLLIVTASAESEALVALDKRTGREVWRKEAQGFAGTWGTPVLVKVADDRTDLVLAVPYEIWGFDPQTGKLRWFCEALNTDSFCSSLTVDGDVVYAVEGRGGGSIAVRAGGSGDVTKTHVVWTGRHNSRISTPLIADGRLYFIAGGIVNCITAAKGDKIFQARLGDGGEAPAAGGGGRGGRGFGGGGPAGGGFGGGGGGRGGRGGQDYSSPVAADGKLYYVSRGGEIHVLKLGETFEKLATNRLTSEPEDFSGTPAISDGQVFIRSSRHLYCVSLPETRGG
jgi:outer membrane protein assembly factor BamB